GGARGLAPGDRGEPRPGGHRGRRQYRRQRRLPHGGRDRRRPAAVRRGPGNARPDRARRPDRGRSGEPRAADAARGARGWSPGAGPRGRGGHGRGPDPGGGHRPPHDRMALPGPGPVADSPGLGGGGRGEPHGGAPERAGLRDHDHPAHPGRHDAGEADARQARQPRDGYDRQVRAAHPAAQGAAGPDEGAGRTRGDPVSESQFVSIEEGIEEIRAGRMLIVVDDEDRENEGDLLMAAEKATPEAVNFMARHGRGLICMPMMGERLDELQISMMVSDNTAPLGTAFTVSVDARRGVTTGTSAYDRAVTIRTLVDPATRPEDLTRPGHIFPLRAMPGGVLRRAGHTEAAVDLARLAGFAPAGVICEVLDQDGGMARLPELMALAREFHLKAITIKALIEYRIHKEKLVRRAATTRMPTEHGDYQVIAYETTVDERQPLALVLGDVKTDEPVLVRVHSECLTGDVFGSLRCDCGPQLHKALAIIQHAGRGILVYMRQEGR